MSEHNPMAAEHEGYHHPGIPPRCQACAEQEPGRDQLLVRAQSLTLRLRETRALYGELSRERAGVVRKLFSAFGMRQREIGEALGMSAPRVNEIIHGARPRKRTRTELGHAPAGTRRATA